MPSRAHDEHLQTGPALEGGKTTHHGPWPQNEGQTWVMVVGEREVSGAHVSISKYCKSSSACTHPRFSGARPRTRTWLANHVFPANDYAGHALVYTTYCSFQSTGRFHLLHIAGTCSQGMPSLSHPHLYQRQQARRVHLDSPR